MRNRENGREQLVILSGRHRPVELSIIFATLTISTLELIVTQEASTARIIRELFPSSYWLWNAFLILGACIALAGSFWKNLVEALLAERIGLLILATAFLAYGLGVMIIRNPISFSAYYFAFIGIGMFTRAFQITLDLRALELALKNRTPPPTLIVTDGPITDPNLPRVKDTDSEEGEQ